MFREYAEKFERIVLAMLECSNSSSEAEIVLREHEHVGLLDGKDCFQYALYGKMERVVASSFFQRYTNDLWRSPSVYHVGEVSQTMYTVLQDVAIEDGARALGPVGGARRKGRKGNATALHKAVRGSPPPPRVLSVNPTGHLCRCAYTHGCGILSPRNATGVVSTRC